MKNISRRRFLKASLLTAGTVGVLPGSGLLWPKASAQSSVHARVRGANEDIRVAVVGFNGRGNDHIKELTGLKGVRLVALCDVDWAYTDKNLSRLDTDVANLQAHIDHPDATPTNGKPAPKVDPEKAKARLASILHLKNDLIPKAKRYSDYRKMLDQQKDIDAVVVATPDHMHAPIALASMDLKKHPSASSE